MERAYDAVFLVKRLHASFRLQPCPQAQREAVAAVLGSTGSTLCRKAAHEKGRALFSSCSYSAWPNAVKAQGSHLYQQGFGSSFCTQTQQTQHQGPDISLLDPVVQKQWDHARNAHLGNTVIEPQTHLKVWWTCDQCPDGHRHSWPARVYERSNGKGCPQCSGRKVCKHNSLATRAPKVAAQWDYEVNDGTPASVVAQSSQLVGWCCHACGHKWIVALSVRVRKSGTLGCPLCSRHWTKHPTFAQSLNPLLDEWDHIRNAARGYAPDNVTLRSKKQIFWLCTKCPAGQEHSWSATPLARTGPQRTACPFCAGRAACKCNSLQALYPDIAAEWDHSKNTGQPSNFTSGSHYSAWWLSPQRGSWQQTINGRVQKEKRRTFRLRRIQQRQSYMT